jgi:hypothetical protein
MRPDAYAPTRIMRERASCANAHHAPTRNALRGGATRREAVRGGPEPHDLSRRSARGGGPLSRVLPVDHLSGCHGRTAYCAPLGPRWTTASRP